VGACSLFFTAATGLNPAQVSLTNSAGAWVGGWGLWELHFPLAAVTGADCLANGSKV
jgi:hypothetical protein